MPAYNVGEYIYVSINSVLKQTYSDFELIIINDGSTDNTEEIIKGFKDDRIKYVLNPENRGLIYSLNAGINMATGEYIARMDADDVCFLNRFETQVKFLDENKNVMILGTAIKTFRNNLHDGKVHKNPSSYEDIKAKAFFDTVFSHPTVMFRRELIYLGYCYDDKYIHSEDSELWSRIITKHCAFNLDEVLVHYRVHDKSVSRLYKSSQIEISNKVKIEYLKNLNIELDSFELNSYGSLSKNVRLMYDHEENSRTLITAIEVLNRIIKKNKIIGFTSHSSLKYYCLYYASKYIVRNWKLSIFNLSLYFVFLKLFFA